jgi:antitoxin component YwqK of YwqJK toxin-antitoxin module
MKFFIYLIILFALTANAAEQSIVQRYGYGPGRKSLKAYGWHADNVRGHATDFEEHCSFSRILVGLKDNFIRAYLWKVDDYPGVKKPGRIIVRARRLGDSSKIVLHNQGMGICSYLQKINDKYWITSGQHTEPAKQWGNTNIWNQWHDYAIVYDGKKRWIEIDGDPKTRVILKERASDHAPHLSLGMGYAYGKKQYFDVESVRFEPFDKTIKPLPELKLPEDGVYKSNGMICNFRNGKEQGLMKQFYPDGKLKMQGHCVDSKRDEKWLWYYPNGKKCQEVVYNKGKFNSIWRRWYPDGKLESERPFKNDVANGKWKRNYPNGKLRCNGEYKNGIMTGYWSAYNPNGKIRWEHEAIGGKKYNYLRTYHSDGKLKKEILYNKGEVVK